MAWLRSDTLYDRGRLLADAARARRRGRSRKALGLYQRVLALEPDNTELLRKVASLLAAEGPEPEAWETYRRAAELLARRGFVEQAIGTLREASRPLCGRRELWLLLADLELERGRPVDAHGVLLEGRRHFRSRRQRSDAIVLLLRARQLAPRDFATGFDLARQLARAGARPRAWTLLEELAGGASGWPLWRVRTRQLALSPTPRALWRWLRAIAGRS